MSVLNVALADIRITPYAQIINSNYAFSCSEFCCKSKINGEAYSGAESGGPLSMSAFMDTSFLILHPHCHSTAKSWWHLKRSSSVSYVIRKMTNKAIKNLTWLKILLWDYPLDAQGGQNKSTLFNSGHRCKTHGLQISTVDDPSFLAFRNGKRSRPFRWI